MFRPGPLYFLPRVTESRTGEKRNIFLASIGVRVHSLIYMYQMPTQRISAGFTLI